MNKDCSGFTLVELVTVIVLVGILSTYAVVRFPSQNELILPAQAQMFVSHIRHVQALAMQWGQPLRMTVTSGGYTVACVTAGAAPCDVSPVIDPATGQAFNVVLETGITLSASSSDFDSMGRPVSGGALVGATSSYTMTSNGSTNTIQISPITGFVIRS
jgi:MSHA pilin protein MshC